MGSPVRGTVLRSTQGDRANYASRGTRIQTRQSESRAAYEHEVENGLLPRQRTGGHTIAVAVTERKGQAVYVTRTRQIVQEARFLAQSTVEFAGLNNERHRNICATCSEPSASDA